MSFYRIEELFNYEKGSLQSTKCTPGQYNFITASSEWKTHSSFTHNCEALVFAAAASGSLGRTHYVNDKFIASDLCFILTPKDSIKYPIDLKFYHIIFNLFRDDIVRNTKAGTSKEAIGLSKFGKYELPYFGIDHQEIVKEQFGNVTEIKDILREEQNYQENIVTQLRQAFLREAMQGKMTENWRNSILKNHPELVSCHSGQSRLSGSDPESISIKLDDGTIYEPASELLKKIKAEKAKLIAEGKIKKEKNAVSPYGGDKEGAPPYEIPPTWVWCRLDEIGRITGGGTPSMSNNSYWDGNIPWISPKDMSVEEIYDSEMKVTEEGVRNSSTNYIPVGSLIIVGRSGILKRKIPIAINRVTCTVNQDMKVIIPYCTSMNRYLQLMLKGLEGIILKSYVKYGMTVHSLKYKEFESMPIPLPPLAEQQRIVSKLNELMHFCDQLEQNINTTKEQTNLLLQTVLREALEPKESQLIS